MPERCANCLDPVENMTGPHCPRCEADVPVIRYPHCRVRLTGYNGNSFAITGVVQRNLKRHLRRELERSYPFTEIEVKAYLHESMRGNYAHLLHTAEAWVEVV